ncbi:rab-GTPase-TBC domain-containing protein [Gongronella butleri]|nr:rab-GTPase-TBC domain-containing protein [Gongronella butleri]
MSPSIPLDSNTPEFPSSRDEKGLFLDTRLAVDHDSDDSHDEDASGLRSNRSTVTSFSSLLSHDTNYDMLLDRLGSPLASTIAAAPLTPAPSTTSGVAKPPARPSSCSTTTSTITATSTMESNNEFNPPADVDWEFWSSVVSDMGNVKRSAALVQHSRYGIPSSIRGTIWQLLVRLQQDEVGNGFFSKKKDKSKMDVDYVAHLDQASIFDQAIAKDLDCLFQESRLQSHGNLHEPLMHLLKAYANYDSHVGYAKGFANVALPLLLHMPEEEAFPVFIGLMDAYDWKSMYVPPHAGLGCFLYQWDRLFKDDQPDLYHRWSVLGLLPHDYIKPWLTSLFVARLPLTNVYRIYDVLFAEGTNALFGFFLAILKRNHDILLTLQDKEEIMQFLAGPDLDVFEASPEGMMQASLEYKLSHKLLLKLSKEYHTSVRKGSVPVVTVAPHSNHARRPEDAELLRLTTRQNKALMDSVKQQQAKLERLTKEHMQAAQALGEAKAAVVAAQNDNRELRQNTAELKKALDALPDVLRKRINDQIHTLAAENMTLVDRNSDLELNLSQMEAMFSDIKTKFAQSENEREELSQRMSELRDIVNA